MSNSVETYRESDSCTAVREISRLYEMLNVLMVFTISRQLT